MYTTIAEFIEEWSQEAASTQKVLDTLTDTSLQQQVSPNSRTLGEIAWHIITSTPQFLSHFGITIDTVKDSATVPSSAKEIAENFRKISADATESVKRQWTDESLKQVQNAFGRNLPNAAILSLLIKHIIHHRGQMTVLMRQAGLKVPGVYGPAKEEWSQMGMEAPTI
ncbi:DinB family protein [Laceyella putida]|uniref:DinB family protein n=1 Tax=Laceyella putida TaxID=110101 RepID=A0ABW2RF95_9BACL